MSYEQMILTVADNGLSPPQRIHFQSTKQLKGHHATEHPFHNLY